MKRKLTIPLTIPITLTPQRLTALLRDGSIGFTIGHTHPDAAPIHVTVQLSEQAQTLARFAPAELLPPVR
jgi:hypothetical protein